MKQSQSFKVQSGPKIPRAVEFHDDKFFVIYKKNILNLDIL